MATFVQRTFLGFMIALTLLALWDLAYLGDVPILGRYNIAGPILYAVCTFLMDLGVAILAAAIILVALSVIFGLVALIFPPPR